MERVGRPGVVGVLLVLLAVASVVAYQRLFNDPLALGDRGAVTAVVSPDCASLTIEVDGLQLADSRDPQSGTSIPKAWRGESIDGELTLDARTGDDGVDGTFTAEDGTTVAVWGGIEGEVFFQASCALWG